MDEYDSSHNINYDYKISLSSRDTISDMSDILLTSRLVDEYDTLVKNMRAALTILDYRYITSISARMAYLDKDDILKWMLITVNR